MAPSSPLIVVAGLITGPDGRILLSRRRADQSFAGCWEFPGGKVDPGEAPPDALARELEEELGLRADVGPIAEVLFHHYARFDLLLLLYHCRPGPVAPAPLEVDQVRWFERSELSTLEVPPADRDVVAALAAGALQPGGRCP